MMVVPCFFFYHTDYLSLIRWQIKKYWVIYVVSFKYLGNHLWLTVVLFHLNEGKGATLMIIAMPPNVWTPKKSHFFMFTITHWKDYWAFCEFEFSRSQLINILEEIETWEKSPDKSRFDCTNIWDNIWHVGWKITHLTGELAAISVTIVWVVSMQSIKG